MIDTKGWRAGEFENIEDVSDNKPEGTERE